jgi:hypothetical protein
MPKLFGRKMITLEIYGDKRHGTLDTPTYAKVKDLRASIATTMEDREENLELLLKGKKLPLESTLAEAGVLDGSRIDVNTLTGDEKNDRVYYKNSNRKKGEYNELTQWSSDDESCEDTSDAGGIRIDKVRQLREGANLKLREKLEKKFHKEVSAIDFILQALKMHQRAIYKKTCRMGVLFILAVLILTGGYVFFWVMYETEAEISPLSARLETAIAFITDLDPPGITLYTRSQVEIFSALPDWAKKYWPKNPDDKEFIGEITYEAMSVHFERFKLGYQPVLVLTLSDKKTKVRLYMYLCRENKENIDLYCFLGTMFASLELWCNAEGDLCILTGPYDTITSK